MRDELVDGIPIGLKKRVELARALAAEPSFLILDEPMAGMNQEEKEYMANLLTTIQVRMEDSSWLKKRIYEFFMAWAISAEKRKLEGRQPTLKQRLLSSFGEWLVYGQIKDQYGLRNGLHKPVGSLAFKTRFGPS